MTETKTRSVAVLVPALAAGREKILSRQLAGRPREKGILSRQLAAGRGPSLTRQDFLLAKNPGAWIFRAGPGALDPTRT